MSSGSADAERQSPPPPRIERLAPHHDIAPFSCSEPELDAYLRERAAEDEKRRGAAVYVLVGDDDPTRIMGYYTLSMYHLRRSAATKADQRRLPRYAEVPAVLIGRLALDVAYGGRGLGGGLLFEAIERVLAVSESIPAAAVVVHALHDTAARFYEHHGFTRFGDEPLHLYLPLSGVAARIARR